MHRNETKRVKIKKTKRHARKKTEKVFPYKPGSESHSLTSGLIACITKKGSVSAQGYATMSLLLSKNPPINFLLFGLELSWKSWWCSVVEFTPVVFSYKHRCCYFYRIKKLTLHLYSDMVCMSSLWWENLCVPYGQKWLAYEQLTG